MCDNTRHGYRGPVIYAAYEEGYATDMAAGFPDRNRFLMARDHGSGGGIALYRMAGAPGEGMEFELVPDPAATTISGQPPPNILRGVFGVWDDELEGRMRVTDAGEILTSIPSRGQLERWDSAGEYLGAVTGPFPEHPAGLWAPWAMDVDPSGTIHLGERHEGTVVRLSSDGEVLGRYREGVGARRLGRPLSIAALEDGSTVVVEEHGDRLIMIGRDGSPSYLPLRHSLAEPWGVCRSPGDRLWVWDRADQSLRGFGPDGHQFFVTLIRLSGSHRLHDGVPMACDDRRVVLSDDFGSQIVVVSPADGRVERLSADQPTGVAIDGSRLLYLSDAHDRVFRLRMPGR
jgi:hypothetical protein